MVFWLREKKMDRVEVAAHVRQTRELFSRGDVRATRSRSDGRHLHRGGDTVAVDGQAAFEDLFGYIDEFTVDEASHFVGEVHKRTLWGPNLVEPSPRTRISPWVMGGEPCVRDTRIPTSTIHALHRSRALPAAAITELYPGLSVDDVEDALALECKLRGEGVRVAA